MKTVKGLTLPSPSPLITLVGDGSVFPLPSGLLCLKEPRHARQEFWLCGGSRDTGCRTPSWIVQLRLRERQSSASRDPSKGRDDYLWDPQLMNGKAHTSTPVVQL